uniref:Uncharacterized protein n=1 Tax=Fagus sylvatica TaxID=28930 RepID=A0A2N9IZL2_FAGSY
MSGEREADREGERENFWFGSVHRPSTTSTPSLIPQKEAIKNPPQFQPVPLHRPQSHYCLRRPPISRIQTQTPLHHSLPISPPPPPHPAHTPEGSDKEPSSIPARTPPPTSIPLLSAEASHLSDSDANCADQDTSDDVTVKKKRRFI